MEDEMDVDVPSTATARPTLTLDKQSEKGFVSFFRSTMSTKPENTLRLFERTDFYTVHGDDAVFVAQTVFKTSTIIKYLGGDATTGLPGVAMSKMQTISLIKDLLLNKQFRVEIWAQDRSNWKIKQKGSPGNLQDFEEMLFQSTDLESSPIVLAIKLGTNSSDEKVIGVGYADATQRRLGVAEIPQTDTFANLEALALQLGAKECVLPDDNSYEIKKIQSILERCNIAITVQKKGTFTTKNIEQDLGRLLPDDKVVTSLREFELKVALSSVAALITYLEVLGDDHNFGQYRLSLFDLSVFMKLDAAAAKALNLMPTPHEAGNKTMSLFGLLNKCKTPQGNRLLQQWLKQPLLDMSEIDQRQNIVEAFIESTELRQTLQTDHLKKIPDLSRLAKRFQRNSANLQDVVRAYQVCLRIPSLLLAFEMYSGKHSALLQSVFVEPIQKHASAIEKYQQMVETTIDLDQLEKHQFLIKPDYDPQLKELRAEIDKLVDELPALLELAAKDLGVEANKKLKMEENNNHGHCFKLTRTDAGKIRGQKQYIELSTNKGGVLFTTSKLKSISDKHSQKTAEYTKIQSELVKEIINICATYCPVFESLNETTSYLDVLLSFADVAVHAPVPYVRPTVLPRGKGDLVLKSARHACLEVQDDVTFIANDVEMIRGTSDFQIITGANMGGKSTYIRQIGLVILMTQIGCFVPCETAQVPLCDGILARVGAGDSQLKGVSTFMAEMLETAAILKNASKESFIIIDELGRGTSTYDGFGLAWAISQYIATRIGCLCLFATHFHELTALSDKVPTVKNIHVTTHVADGALTLLYKVQPGICDQSFGIHVAQLARFPERVVNLAKRKALELEDFSTSQNGTTTTSPAITTTTKRSKQEIDEADGVFKAFLQDVKALPLDALSDQEAFDAIAALKQQYFANPSDAIKDIFVEL